MARSAEQRKVKAATSQSRKRLVAHSITDQEMRDQEVVRANRELAAYFKGHRTEREARAALKIIRAFVRQRERDREKRPLPGMQLAQEEKPVKTPSKRAKSGRAAHPGRRDMAGMHETSSDGSEPTPRTGPITPPDEQG
jgi:hypothetical protein